MKHGFSGIYKRPRNSGNSSVGQKCDHHHLVRLTSTTWESTSTAWGGKNDHRALLCRILSQSTLIRQEQVPILRKNNFYHDNALVHTTASHNHFDSIQLCTFASSIVFFRFGHLQLRIVSKHVNSLTGSKFESNNMVIDTRFFHMG